jgi:rRNA maturation RNase YbeY
LAILFHEQDVSAEIKNKNLLKKWLKGMVLLEDAIPGKINIIFTSDSHLLELNKKYLARDYLTDVITFDYSENQAIAGDIYISVMRVKENATIYGGSFDVELKRVMAHGILHLLGYDDKTEKQISLMRRKEDYYLSQYPEI